MKSNEYLKLWKEWQDKADKINNEYIIMDDYMNYVYETIILLQNLNIIDGDDVSSVIPKLILEEFKKINNN